MKFFDRLEEKFGRFAIKNLTLYLVILNIAGFILLYTNPAFYYLHLSLDMERIFAGEVWRLFTFMIYPSTDSILLLFLEMFILYSLGNTLERLWGRFYYNLYIFLGMFFLVIAALAIYLINGSVLWLTPSNMYMTLLLAFAMTLPDMQFLLYFIIPIKAKYLAIFYVGIMVYEFIRSNWTGRIAVIASFANAIIFFLMIKNPAKRAGVPQAPVRHEGPRRGPPGRAPAADERHAPYLLGLRPDRKGRSESGIPLLQQVQREPGILPGPSVHACACDGRRGRDVLRTVRPQAAVFP